jgi:hypothetical protein
MKEKSETISTELEQLEARRESLSTDTEAARLKLSEAREGLITGATGAKQITAAQAEYSALSEAVTALDERIEARREDLASARKDEQRAADLARTAEISAERFALQAELQSIVEAGNAVLVRAVADYKERFARWLALRSEAEVISSQTSGSDVTRANFRRDELQLPSVEPFGAAVYLALQIDANHSDRERQKEASRAATERRQQQERERQQQREAVQSL